MPAVELSSSKVPADILNNFWIQVAVSLLKQPHGDFEIGTRFRSGGLNTTMLARQQGRR
jgi:hypothetical protein